MKDILNIHKNFFITYFKHQKIDIIMGEPTTKILYTRLPIYSTLYIKIKKKR